MNKKIASALCIFSLLVAAAANGEVPGKDIIDTHASLISLSLTYPPQAIRDDVEGTTLVQARVMENGTAESITVLRSSGVKTLDDAAIDAVRKATFKPSAQNGKPIASYVRLPIQFKLEDAPASK